MRGSGLRPGPAVDDPQPGHVKITGFAKDGYDMPPGLAEYLGLVCVAPHGYQLPSSRARSRSAPAAVLVHFLCIFSQVNVKSSRDDLCHDAMAEGLHLHERDRTVLPGVVGESVLNSVCQPLKYMTTFGCTPTAFANFLTSL